MPVQKWSEEPPIYASNGNSGIRQAERVVRGRGVVARPSRFTAVMDNRFERPRTVHAFHDRPPGSGTGWYNPLAQVRGYQIIARFLRGGAHGERVQLARRNMQRVTV